MGGVLDLLLSDTLDGDEQAHDRGGACGAICHVDDQVLSPIGRSTAS